MLVFRQQRLILLATPKTASTALHAALAPAASIVLRDPPGLKHTPLRRLRAVLAPLLRGQSLDDYETMALIREPVDWLSSWYRYRTRPALRGQPNSTAGMDFDDFVEAYLQAPRPPFADVGQQSRFLSDREGRPGVNHLFAYEKLDQALRFLERRLGRSVRLEYRNRSPRMACRLSPSLLRRLQRELATDFALHAAAIEGRYAQG